MVVAGGPATANRRAGRTCRTRALAGGLATGSLTGVPACRKTTLAGGPASFGRRGGPAVVPDRGAARTQPAGRCHRSPATASRTDGLMWAERNPVRGLATGNRRGALSPTTRSPARGPATGSLKDALSPTKSPVRGLATGSRRGGRTAGRTVGGRWLVGDRTLVLRDSGPRCGCWREGALCCGALWEDC